MLGLLTTRNNVSVRNARQAKCKNFNTYKYRSEVKFSNVPGGILRMLCDDKSL